MTKRKLEELDFISYEDIKIGQYIQLEDNTFYTVCKYHDNYKLIPIDLKNVRTIPKDGGLWEGNIIAVYDAKNGDLIKRKRIIKIEEMEEGK